MASTFIYDAAQHFMTIGGFPISGFQDGSEVTIEFDEDQMTKQVDIDGNGVVFNRTNNHLATVTFTLNEGSPANEFLSELMNDFRNNNGGIEAFFFKDNNSGTTAQSDACTVQSAPSQGGGRESSGREWTIGTGQLRMEFAPTEAAI